MTSRSHICSPFTIPYEGQKHFVRCGIIVLYNPQIPIKTCTSFTFLRVGLTWTLSITPSETMCVLPTHMTSRNFIAITGSWIFCRVTTHPLSCRRSSRGFKVSYSRGMSSRVNIIWSCNEPILLMQKRRIKGDLNLPSNDILWDCTGDPGEAHERSIVTPPLHEGKLILVIRNLYLSESMNPLEDETLLQEHFGKASE